MVKSCRAVLIFALCIVLCTMQALAYDGVDTSDMVSLDVSRISYAYANVAQWNTLHTLSDYVEGVPPLPQSFDSVLLMSSVYGESEVSHILVGTQFEDDDGLSYYLEGDYTYVLHYNISLNWQDMNAQPKSFDPYDWTVSSFFCPSLRYSFDDYNIDLTQPSFDFVSGIVSATFTPTSSVIYMSSIDYEVCFHTPLSWDPLTNTSMITVFDIKAGNPSLGTATWNCHITSVEAFRDPERVVVEDESEKIIQGQKDAVDYGLDQELSATNAAADDAEDDASAAAANAFDFSSFASALGSLVNALSYSGTNFSFTLPAAQGIPYIGSLWGDTQIPIKEFIDYLPVGLLYIIRFLAWLALLFSVVKMIRNLISDINGGGDD